LFLFEPWALTDLLAQVNAKDQIRLARVLKNWQDRKIFSTKMCTAMFAKTQSQPQVAANGFGIVAPNGTSNGPQPGREREWLNKHPKARGLLRQVSAANFQGALYAEPFLRSFRTRCKCLFKVR
jgi:hypothetical protein